MPRHNKTTEPIRLYEISGLANAGIYIKPFAHGPELSDHDVSVAHRDNHYLLMVAVSGYYRGLVDFRNFESDGPCIGIILPGQVHQVDLITAPAGWSIAFDPALMPDNLKHKLEGYFSRQPLLPYQELLQERVTQLTALMCDIYQECGQSNTATALHALLHAILGLISRQLEDLPADGGDKQRRAFIIERDFWELLHQHYKEWKKPSDYAGALNISVSHLNDTIREITGCSASYQIRQMAVLEAKRLLYHTDLTAREIGYEVGYDDPVYFSRLFRKTTGQTPLAFRGKFRD